MMATHPVEPQAPEPGQAPHHHPEAPEPNTTRLPVEPEFAADWKPAQPEDPGAKPPPT
jgi:hypothetical protein